jgi:hypothetical protein
MPANAPIAAATAISLCMQSFHPRKAEKKPEETTRKPTLREFSQSDRPKPEHFPLTMTHPFSLSKHDEKQHTRERERNEAGRNIIYKDMCVVGKNGNSAACFPLLHFDVTVSVSALQLLHSTKYFVHRHQSKKDQET